VTDAVLIRAPVGVVYRTLTDLDGWPSWLEGCRVRRIEGAAPPSVVGEGTFDHHLILLPDGRRRRRLRVVAYGWRHDAGMRWEVTWRGRRPGGVGAEWWLEAGREGVIVHHLVHEDGQRAARAVLRYRRNVVLALQAMKDHLELAVAHAAGRVP